MFKTKFQMSPNLSVTVGVRYDWDGGADWRKMGTSSTSIHRNTATTPESDTITSSGFIIAGNNVNGTPGVSKTTLTGRQWGIAPRLGFAWQPSMFHSKFVVRGGGGFYYRSRPALYLSLARLCLAGEVDGGPFGNSQN